MTKNHIDYFVHFSVAMVGGFIGAYTLLEHHELFGNAQTSNMIHIAICIVGGSFVELGYRLLNLMMYFLGFACTVVFRRFTKWNLHICSVGINLLTIVLLAYLPASLNDYLFLMPVFFAMAFQWNSFRGVGEYLSSTIFSTNNLRQFSTSLCEFFCDFDKKHLHKTGFYGLTLLSYHTGVVVAYFATVYFGLKGVYAGLGCILLSGIAVFLEYRNDKNVDNKNDYKIDKKQLTNSGQIDIIGKVS